MMTDGKHEGTPPEGEGDALWRLLERTPQPRPVSPYFARRVLREVAAFEKDHLAAGGAWNWLARMRQAWRRTPGMAVAGTLTVVTLLTVGGAGLSLKPWHPSAVSKVVSRPELAVPEAGLTEEALPPEAEATAHSDPSPASVSEPAVTAQDVEVIADLDNVLSREESRLWTEDDTARF